jgi:hypothetical protein
MSATIAWAGAPPVVEGPPLDAAPAACCAPSRHGSCRQAALDWLSYHPAHCAGCGWCHNCNLRQPPLYTFFLDYGWNSDGGKGWHGPNGCAAGACKSCATKTSLLHVAEKASKP